MATLEPLGKVRACSTAVEVVTEKNLLPHLGVKVCAYILTLFYILLGGIGILTNLLTDNRLFSLFWSRCLYGRWGTRLSTVTQSPPISSFNTTIHQSWLCSIFILRWGITAIFDYFLPIFPPVGPVLYGSITFNHFVYIFSFVFLLPAESKRRERERSWKRLDIHPNIVSRVVLFQWWGAQDNKQKNYTHTHRHQVFLFFFFECLASSLGMTRKVVTLYLISTESHRTCSADKSYIAVCIFDSAG